MRVIDDFTGYEISVGEEYFELVDPIGDYLNLTVQCLTPGIQEDVDYLYGEKKDWLKKTNEGSDQELSLDPHSMAAMVELMKMDKAFIDGIRQTEIVFQYYNKTSLEENDIHMLELFVKVHLLTEANFKNKCPY
ncbi:MAG: hypothetical protein CMM25_05910 [Rhodospirillaceae bacterium]|nr:hypothetical protein [Rhodospirillaceae bacterium]